MTNPLALALSNPVGDAQEVSRLWREAMVSDNKTGRRLATLVLKSAKVFAMSYNPGTNTYLTTHLGAACEITEDPFEAALIAVALDGAWNDIINSAWAALGLPEDGDRELSAWNATIDGLSLD